MKDEILEIDGYKIVIHEIENINKELLLEGKDKGKNLTKQYSYHKHSAHNPTGQEHLHIYKRGNQILSINKDGSGHDGYSGTRIPNKVFNALNKNFPDWDFPSNQIVESEEYITFFQSMRNNLRRVKVFEHKNYELNFIKEFEGYFHTFGDDPFLVGSQGYKNRTIAIIEKLDGNISKVPVTKFKFLDI